ncbi:MULTISPECIES: hypothetical protein [Flammeovirga]|uniref:Outer membrane protein beta-barrel domain-containing protein n=1 Tax=Flammeovirga agarivorans TaxID=2726742 RepID=A0A7X8SJD1_9BACT|nr:MULTISPECIES: hypothetical protein [Flammeovirga]NLR91329.1 hypothetical protein [Flammeovirga agarivorans]
MKPITILFLFSSSILFAQEQKQDFFNSVSFSCLAITEIAGQWRPFDDEDEDWYNIPLEDRKEEDIPHAFFSGGFDFQLNYTIDKAALIGIGWQNQYFTGRDMLAPMNTYYLHFRTGDDFDSKYCLYVELDLGGCFMDKYLEGIMYRATFGIELNELKLLRLVPTANVYIGQRVLSNISSIKHAGGFYNMIGLSAGFRFN